MHRQHAAFLLAYTLHISEEEQPGAGMHYAHALDSSYQAHWDVTWERMPCNECLRHIQLWQPPQCPHLILHREGIQPFAWLCMTELSYLLYTRGSILALAKFKVRDLAKLGKRYTQCKWHETGKRICQCGATAGFDLRIWLTNLVNSATAAFRLVLLAIFEPLRMA